MSFVSGIQNAVSGVYNAASGLFSGCLHPQDPEEEPDPAIAPPEQVPAEAAAAAEPQPALAEAAVEPAAPPSAAPQPIGEPDDQPNDQMGPGWDPQEHKQGELHQGQPAPFSEVSPVVRRRRKPANLLSPQANS